MGPLADQTFFKSEPEISRIRVTLFKEVLLALKHMLIVCLRSFLDDCSSRKLHDSEIVQRACEGK